MSKLPPLPPPTVEHVIEVGTAMQIWCDFCRIQYAVRRGDLAEWAAEHPPRLERLGMEAWRMMRCKHCGRQALNGVFSGNPHYRSSALGPSIDPEDDDA